MPGNEIGDRVYNFFPEENLVQELHHSPALDSNLPVSGDYPWAGSQRQVCLGNSSVKNYNLQEPEADSERGQIGNNVHGQNGLNFPQLTLRPEFGYNQSPVQPSKVNGLLAGDTNFNQHDLSSRGLFNYGLQQASGPENQTKSSVRAATPGSVGFDLFGGQQPMNNQQLSMLQSLRHQLSGMKDMQQLQQQVMLMKMQELQRQQQLQQVDIQQQNTLNQIPFFPKQASGSNSLAMANSSQSGDGLGNHWANEVGTNWLQRNTPSLPGSSSVLAFSPSHSPAQSAVDIAPQPGEQSLYGVPVSGSRGILNQYSHKTTDKSPVQQLASFGNTTNFGNQYNASSIQVNAQKGISFAKQKFQVENSFKPASDQAPSPVRAENFQQAINMQRNSPQQEFRGMQMRDVVQDSLPEKSEMQITSSQADVALDPTEERILFGSDDNLWAAFGKNQEDGNPFDGGAFSALMQSAVAETCSGDTRLKEEWSGLNFQKPDLPLGSQHVRTSNDGGKQPSFAGGNLVISSSSNSGFLSGSNDANINKNYKNIHGFQHFGGNTHSETGQVPHANSQPGLAHSSQEGGQWSNGILARNFLDEVSLGHRNALQSLDGDIQRSIPGSWRPEGSRQIPSKQDGCNAFESVTTYQDADVMVHGDGNSLQHPWGNDRMQVTRREVQNGGAPWTLDSAGDQISEVEQVKPSGGNMQMNSEGFGVNNPTTTLDSSAMKAGQGISSSYLVNNWKFVDPVVHSKGNEAVRNLQHDSIPLYNDKRHEMENSDNQENSYDSHHSSFSHHASADGRRESVFSDAIDSRTKSATQHKYNQTDMTNSAPRKFQYHPMGDLGDLEAAHGMKQSVQLQSVSHFAQPKFFGQIPNKFVEMGRVQPPDCPMSIKAFNEVLSHSQGSVIGTLPSMSAPFNRMGDTQATNKASQSSQNMLELLHKVDQSEEHGATMHANSSQPSSSSELPPAEKSDGSVGRLQRSLSSHSQSFSLQLGPPSQQHSIPNHALTSQSYLQMTNSTHSSYVAVDTGHDGFSSVPASVHIVPSSSERSQQNKKIDIPGDLGQLGNEVYKLSGNFSASVNLSFLSSGQVENPEAVSACGQVSRSYEKEASNSAQKWDHPRIRPSGDQSAETSFRNDAGSSLDNNASPGNASLPFGTDNLPYEVSATLTSRAGPLPVSPPTSIAGLSSQGPLKASSLGTNIIAQQHLLGGAQFRRDLPQSYQTMRVNSDSLAYFNQYDQDTNKEVAIPTDFANGSANSQGVGPEEEKSLKGGIGQQIWPKNMDMVPKENAPHGKEPFSRTGSDGAPANSASMQSDIEAFGRSLKPNKFQQNPSFLNPMRSMPGLKNDPSQLVLRRMKGQDNRPGAQLLAPMARLSDDHNAMTDDTIVPPNSIGHSGDTAKCFSGPLNNAEKSLSLEHTNVTSQGLLALGHNVSLSSNDSAPVKVDHSKISRQMAPSWFNQYDALRNGQILPLYDSHKAAIAKSGEQPFTLEKPSSAAHFLSSTGQVTAAAIGVSKVGHIQQSASSSSVAKEHASSQVLPANVTDQYPVVLRTKKRKSATSELIPWCKEVLWGSRNPQTISMAEIEWSKAANRLTQKVEEDVDFLDDGPPMIRSKRRLILTTQLMQQLLRPAPAAILSVDANTDYETVAYSVSRLVLGEACSMVSPANEKSTTSTDGINRLSGECKTSDRLDQCHLKVAEEFTARARKLESDFLRVDKGASLLDMIVEYQDLEKFSVINRFAKFHGRGQAENADTASSSDAAANTQKPCPQRYVTALPLPRSLPTGVQCHSL